MDHPADVLAALYAAYNAHDTEAIAGLYADDAIHEDIAVARPVHGARAIADGMRRLLDAFPDAQWTTTDVAHGPNTAFGRYVLTGTLQSDFGPFTASDQSLRLNGVHVLHCRHGQITRSEDHWDSATFGRQMSRA
jgi:steroid delta-isomerase-like uncharacterized protein